MKFKPVYLSAVAMAAVLAAPVLHAKTFKWSSASDIPTMDIHSQNNALGNGVHAAIYDALVYYNSKTFKPEPQLATAWQQVSPTQVRFTLRMGVKFSDGSPLTADDVVYSLTRSMAKTSNYAVFAQGIDKVVKVNDNTIDILLKAPTPTLVNQLTELRIMSRAWAEKNKSLEPTSSSRCWSMPRKMVRFSAPSITFMLALLRRRPRSCGLGSSTRSVSPDSSAARRVACDLIGW